AAVPFWLCCRRILVHGVDAAAPALTGMVRGRAVVVASIHRSRSLGLAGVVLSIWPARLVCRWPPAARRNACHAGFVHYGAKIQAAAHFVTWLVPDHFGYDAWPGGFFCLVVRWRTRALRVSVAWHGNQPYGFATGGGFGRDRSRAFPCRPRGCGSGH